MRFSFRSAASLLLLSFSFALAAQETVSLPPLHPASAYEPPQSGKSLTESTNASPPELITTDEKTDFKTTGSYDEAIRIAKELEKRSKFAKLINIGKSPEGRDLWVLVASKDRAFRPELAHKSGKPFVFVQSGIHSGEIEGKPAMLMLMRDILVTGRHADLIDKVDFAILLLFNVDGHVRTTPYNRSNQQGPEIQGTRPTGQLLNLNRDYVKAEAPEMHAWLRFFNAWKPDLIIDHHVTNGMDFQYDLTIDMPENEDTPLPIARWTTDQFLPELYKRMEGDGHLMAPYGFFDPAHPERGYRTQIFSPRFSQAYAGARNRAGLLIETHSLKTARTRAWANYDVTLHTLKTIGENPTALTAASKQADDNTKALGGSDAVMFLAGKHSDKTAPFTFRGVTTKTETGVVAGGPVPVYSLPIVDTPTKIYKFQDAAVAVKIPEAWAIPPAWAYLAAKLDLHGVPYERLTAPKEVTCETYRLSKPRFSPMPTEGRIPVTVEATAEPGRCKLEAGTVMVSARHPGARIAAHLLEPRAPDSLVYWGFFYSLLERGGYFSPYIMEPMAQKMMAQNPKLREEFEAKLKSDQAFAANPRARLEWFYLRSPYFDRSAGLYPITRVWLSR